MSGWTEHRVEGRVRKVDKPQETPGPTASNDGVPSFSQFSDVALARLALSSELADLADQARSWVDPRFEAGPEAVGELLEKVAAMARQLDNVRTRAVTYARERHLSWDDIAAALGVTSRATPHERYAAAAAQWRERLYSGDLVGALGTEDLGLRARTLDRWVTNHRAPGDLRLVDDDRPVSDTLRRRDPRTATTASGAYARLLEWSSEQTSRTTWLNAKIRAGETLSPAVTAAVGAHRAAADAAMASWQAEEQERRAGLWTAWILPYGGDEQPLSFTVARIKQTPPERDAPMHRWAVHVDYAGETAATGTIDVYANDNAADAVAETIRLLLGVEHIAGDVHIIQDLAAQHERLRAVLQAGERGDFAAVSISMDPAAIVLDDYAEDVLARCRWARAHNDGHPRGVWSTGEQLAVALVLRDHEHLTAMGYTSTQAAQRVIGDTGMPAEQIPAWLAAIRGALDTQPAQSTQR